MRERAATRAVLRIAREVSPGTLLAIRGASGL